MKRIFKYSLPVLEKFDIELPAGADIIRVDDVDGLFYLWAAVDPEAANVARHIECYKTGQEIDNYEGLKYLGFAKLFIMQELCLYFYERIHTGFQNCYIESLAAVGVRQNPIHGHRSA